MGFRVPLPERCRGCGKREAGSAGSAGETIAFGGFDDAAGGRHGGDALVEGGGANAATGPQIREGLGLAGLGEGGGDAVVEGVWLDCGLGGALAFDDLEGERVGALKGIGGGGGLAG